MPLPWKKPRGNRISRIVADLQPPKRGGSLVVETGFPTSVIDLFVKNRERMKRQSSKKKITCRQFDHDIFDSSAAPPPTPLLSPDYSSVFAAEARGKVVNANCSQGEGEGGEGGGGDGEGAGEGILRGESGGEELVGRGPNANSMIVVAVKMFLVLVLAFSTKTLAVGIPLSAFLLFLQFFGKFAVGFIKPCSDARAGFSDWIRKIYGWFFSERKSGQESKGIAEWTKRNDHNAMACELIDGEEGEEEEESNSNSSSDEIQILEPNLIISCCGAENQQTGQGLQHDFLSREKRWGCLDEDENEEQGKFPASKNQRSKSAKLKAKIIKKLIPKKLRSAKKLVKMNKLENNNKTEYCSVVAGYHYEHVGNGNDMGLVEGQDEQENENGSISSCEEEDEDGVSGQSAEMGLMIGKRKEEMNNNNSECIFLVVMILSGLLGGRFQALLLSVSSCFIFKLIKILNRKWKLKFGCSAVQCGR